MAITLWHRQLPLDQRYPLPPREIAGMEEVTALAPRIAAKAVVGRS